MHLRSLAALCCIVLSFSSTGISSAVAAFVDIADDSTANAVRYLESLGIVEGYADGNFQPTRGINRAEFLKIVYRTVYADESLPDCPADSLRFPDVDMSAWYAQTLCIAAEDGVIGGYPDGTFRPAQPVNVAEAAKIIDRAMFGTEEDLQEPNETWYVGPIWALSDIGALPTTITSLDRPLTRGEMAQMIYRIDTENSYLPSADASDILPSTEDDWYGQDAEDDDLVFMTEDDCYQDETYDPVEHVCYIEIECETAEDCQAQIDALQQEADTVLSESEDFEELQEEDADALARYNVSGNALSLQQSMPSSSEWMNSGALHKEVWQYFVGMVPESARLELGAFEIVTDGKEDTLAAVYQDESLPENKNWVLQVDIVDAYSDQGVTLNRTELAYSLIHEYAHLLTLNATQFKEVDTGCTSYETEEGCTKEQAYLNRFYQRFWAPIATEYSNANSDDALEAFYQKHQERFLTDYAVTSPEEDIAESFAYFVLSQPKGSGIATEKAKFFSQFSELRDLRTVIMQRLDGEKIAQR